MIEYIQQMDPNTFTYFVLKVAGVIVLLMYALSRVRILKEYDRAVIYRLGRVLPAKGPGIIFLIPFIDSTDDWVDMRIQSLELDVQDVITKDNVSIKIHPVLYFQITDAVKSEIAIDGWQEALERLGAKTLRTIGGQNDLNDFLSNSNEVAEQIKKAVDHTTEEWGITITLVEFIGVDLPETMTRAMAAAAEAQRQRQAVVIAAEGEFEAAQKLSDAAKIMADNPISVQLRYMKALTEIGADNATVIAFPIPIELFPHLGKAVAKVLDISTTNQTASK